MVGDGARTYFLVIRKEDVLIKIALDNPLKHLEEGTSHSELRSGVRKFGEQGI